MLSDFGLEIVHKTSMFENFLQTRREEEEDEEDDDNDDDDLHDDILSASFIFDIPGTSCII